MVLSCKNPTTSNLRCSGVRDKPEPRRAHDPEQFGRRWLYAHENHFLIFMGIAGKDSKLRSLISWLWHILTGVQRISNKPAFSLNKGMINRRTLVAPLHTTDGSRTLQCLKSYDSYNRAAERAKPRMLVPSLQISSSSEWYFKFPTDSPHWHGKGVKGNYGL